MRHRAPRPFKRTCLRLPVAAARVLGRTAALRPRTALVTLVALLSVGTAAYAAFDSLRGGTAGPHAGPAASSESRAADLQSASRDSDRQTLPSELSSPSAPTLGASSSPRGTPAATQPAGRRGTASAHASPSASASTSSSASPSASGRDTAPPDTSVSASFPSSNSATFTFGANEPASFSCSLDGAAYTPCDSPMTYSDLASGWHTVAVRAVDAAGNVDPSPAESRWHASVGGSAAE